MAVLDRLASEPLVAASLCCAVVVCAVVVIRVCKCCLTRPSRIRGAKQDDPAEPTRSLAVLRELLATERAYLRDLRKLSASRAALPNDLAALLAGIDALELLHAEIVSTLLGGRDAEAAGSAPPSVAAVAQAFLQLSPYLKTYTEYVRRQYERLACIKLLHGQPAGRQKLDDLLATNGEPLDSLLIKPVQRLCKYPLLLSALIDALPPSAERDQIAAARSLVEGAAAEVNRASAEAEQAVKVLELGPAWRTLVSPTRRLRVCADVELPKAWPSAAGQPPPTPTSIRVARAYLFSDLLVVAEASRPPVFERLASHASAVGARLLSGAVKDAAQALYSPAGAESDRWQPRELMPLSDLETRPASPGEPPRTLFVRKRVVSTVPYPWVPITFVTDSARAKFMKELREALAEHGAQQQASDQRVAVSRERERVASIVRRDANVGDLAR